ncbi:hypothetical protein [Acidovorax sp. A79]|uniref:hypothetical protein n=1 Tax=Acidovorax sp. A79 TaxID=3056107 RepID=UPI0034E8953D
MPEQTIQCASACTVTVVHEITLPVLDLSPAEAAQISSAILLVWSVGWAFRSLIQTIRSDGNSSTQED